MDIAENKRNNKGADFNRVAEREKGGSEAVGRH